MGSFFLAEVKYDTGQMEIHSRELAVLCLWIFLLAAFDFYVLEYAIKLYAIVCRKVNDNGFWN